MGLEKKAANALLVKVNQIGTLTETFDAVNLAQRLQTVALAGQIIISEEVYQIAKESFSCEKIGEVKLKNKSLPVVIYQVLE